LFTYFLFLFPRSVRKNLQDPDYYSLECRRERAEANGGPLPAGDTSCFQWNEYNTTNNPAVCCLSNDHSPECCAQAATNNKLPYEYRERCCEHSQFMNNPNMRHVIRQLVQPVELTAPSLFLLRDQAMFLSLFINVRFFHRVIPSFC